MPRKTKAKAKTAKSKKKNTFFKGIQRLLKPMTKAAGKNEEKPYYAYHPFF